MTTTSTTPRSGPPGDQPPAVPDQLEVDVAVGGRVLVVGDLRLSADQGRGPGSRAASSPTQAAVAAELIAAIDAWSGPGVLVFNGGTVLTGAGPAARGCERALAPHARLVAAVQAWADGPGRRVLVLPGASDRCLAWDDAARTVVTRVLRAEVALAAELCVATGSGERRVRVEPGHAYDDLAAFSDPRNPGETPLAEHLREQVLPAVACSQPARLVGRRRDRPGWLAGAERLDDPAAYPRFVASRLVYRRLGRWAWLLVVPVVAAVVLRLPALLLSRSRTLSSSGIRALLLGAATVVELGVLAALVVLALRSTWQAMAAVALGSREDEPNEAPRAAARRLVTAGCAGLVTGHTCRPELAHLGAGFYANVGCATEVVAEVPGRLASLGAPAVFLAHRQLSWVELEAGADLHVRLLHSRSDLPGATVAERLMVRRGPDDRNVRGDPRPTVVATWPQGASWPPATEQQPRRTLVRRVAALAVAAIGFLTLVSSLSAPLRARLTDVRDLFPLVVPETADFLTALIGIGLLLLARGIRRGQHRAWVVAEVALLVSALLHLLKGVDVEEAIVALALAIFLWVTRSSFQAVADTPPWQRGILAVVACWVLSVVAGGIGIELSQVAARRYPVRVSWPDAFLAVIERMVGVQHVVLPDRVNDFVAPAAAAVAVALLVTLLALAFRPVVVRARTRRAARPVGGDEGTGLARAREVVTRHGSGTLDYFALRPDKDFFFWGDTVVAYAVYGGVCLVSPDPIGPVAEREPAWRAFRAFVDSHGWALGGLGAGEDWLPIYRATGMHDLYVGDEAVVRSEAFTLEGGRFKGLRQAVNRVAKYGYRISFHDPSELEPDLQEALRAVMTKSRRGDVERGFSMTLGRVFEPDDAGLLLAVVHGPAPDTAPEGSLGPPVAFCQYVPAPGIGGYSLDLMRRDDGEHPNGLIDFAVVETIRHLQANGGGGLGLNFATMRAVLAGEAGDKLTTRIQAWLLRRMGDSMQIESLWRFNAKFDPYWQPRYAVYDAPEHALATAVAVARAESFWELPVIGRFLVPPAPGGQEDEAVSPGRSPRSPTPAG
jgi:lysylphosphatidylglycerol synthetase-like protein (DUF2156 family)